MQAVPSSPITNGILMTDLNANGKAITNLPALTLSADDAYSSGWNGSLGVPTKNAVYDKIETLGISVLPVADTTAIVKGSTTSSKQLRFEVDGFNTGTTRVLTPPNYDGTIATQAGNELLTNKTVNGMTFAVGTATGTTDNPAIIDVPGTPYLLKIITIDHTGGNHIIRANGDFDVTMPPHGVLATVAGTIKTTSDDTVASASTLALGSATGTQYDITGSVTVNLITGIAEGEERVLRFSAATILVHSANLLLPGGVNIPTAAGGIASILGKSGGVVAVKRYVPAEFSSRYDGIFMIGGNFITRGAFSTNGPFFSGGAVFFTEDFAVENGPVTFTAPPETPTYIYLPGGTHTMAPLDSPIFTATPAAPTAAADTNTTQLATTAFVLGQATSSTPAPNGTAAIGILKSYARADHVHASQTTITGNAGTATVLATGRTLSITGDLTWTSPSFDGSGNVTAAGTLANIPTGVTAAGTIIHTNVAAPSSPVAGKDSIYTDSTDLRLHDKNASGVIGTTIVADTGASNNFLTGISAAGVISKAQPAFSNLSGSVAATQMPALTGDATTVAGAVAVTFATVNSNTGSFGSSTAIPSFTVNGKGLITAASTNAVVAPAGTLSGATLASGVTASSLTSLGTSPIITTPTISGQQIIKTTSASEHSVIMNGVAQNSSTDNTNGLSMRVGNNSAGNIQWWVGSSADAGSSSQYSARFLVGSAFVPTIDAVRNDGAIAGNINLGGSAANVGIGFTPGTVVQGDITAGLHVNRDAKFNGDIIYTTAGKGFSIKSGTNARAGTLTLVAGTKTVSNTTITANTQVVLTRKTSGGTLGTAITYTLSAGTSFTVNSDSALDTSVFTYLLFENP